MRPVPRLAMQRRTASPGRHRLSAAAPTHVRGADRRPGRRAADGPPAPIRMGGAAGPGPGLDPGAWGPGSEAGASCCGARRDA